MDPLLVLSLAKFVPEIIGLFDRKRGDKAKTALEAVGKVAESITGKKGHDAIDAINSDPNLAYQFQLAVMSDAHVQDQMRLDDLKSARDMYKVHSAQADKVADMIMQYNIILIFLLVVLNVLAVIHLKEDPALLAVVCNFIGIVIGALLNERQAVVGFLFGSSIGSKQKDENQLDKTK